MKDTAAWCEDAVFPASEIVPFGVAFGLAALQRGPLSSVWLMTKAETCLGDGGGRGPANKWHVGGRQRRGLGTQGTQRAGSGESVRPGRVPATGTGGSPGIASGWQAPGATGVSTHVLLHCHETAETTPFLRSSGFAHDELVTIPHRRLAARGSRGHARCV